MDNKKLNFPHTIPIEVFHENNSTTVEIFLNNELKFGKTFAPKKVHKETVTFSHLYQSGQRNQIKFVFSGSAEAESKYLKINSLIINNQLVNIYNANYQPELNPEWWESLEEKDKEKYLEIIYGKNGTTFGWYGKIDVEYLTFFDQKSFLQKRIARDTNDIEVNEIISKKIDKVFLIEDENLPWRRAND